MPACAILHKKASADARPPIDPEVDPDVDESKFDYDDGDWDEVSLLVEALVDAPSQRDVCQKVEIVIVSDNGQPLNVAASQEGVPEGASAACYTA